MAGVLLACPICHHMIINESEEEKVLFMFAHKKENIGESEFLLPWWSSMHVLKKISIDLVFV